MNEYILLMHNDATDCAAAQSSEKWGAYLEMLRQSGQFDGGSSIGQGQTFRQGQAARVAALDLTGFIRVRAQSLEEAQRFLTGNPVYEADGTVQVRELPKE